MFPIALRGDRQPVRHRYVDERPRMPMLAMSELAPRAEKSCGATVKQSELADQKEPIMQALEPSTQICPYCHKSLDDENLLCRLTHEHGKTSLPREHHPLYSELEDLLERCHEALIWCSGSNDFQTTGMAYVGWEKLVRPLLRDLQRALGERRRK